ncbi:MAG: TolC family protein [Hydrogenophaga sp.]|jgi:outer membrane protein TolC|uniref:TolC family protein n=1 Tax=Hydrogenophaga sp. TaxID=1904254 RepID=UPI001E1394E5|nr:TolC family protein [Hydrogenophaga sp.]MBW0171047.1 TolC family protein [Hydrogenophaga sp.]MBW0183856.1 TolC family protein [Hydrogenophaga sp.]
MEQHLLSIPRSRVLWHALVAAIAWLAIATTPAEAATSEPLSLNAAVRSALAHSRGLQASDAAAAGAHDMAVAAAQRPDPVLRLSLDNLPVNGPDRFSTTRDFMTMRSVALMQTLPNADKRRARGERFEREADAALSERIQRLAELQQAVAQAWLERRLQEQRVQVLQAQIDEARVLVNTTEAATRGGRGATTDWIAAREALAQLEQALIGVQADAANARLTLARWTGGPPQQPLAQLPAISHTTLNARTLTGRVDELPDLAALQAREAVARAEAELARQEQRPDWTAELMFSQRGSQYSNMVSIAVSVPLQWDAPRRQQRELAARLARVNGLLAEREEQARERRLQIERWQQDWRSGLARMAFLQRERQPLAEQRTEAALAAYRGGRESLGAVLQARRQMLELQLERINLERETAGLWARLEYLIPDTTATQAARPE